MILPVKDKDYVVIQILYNLQIYYMYIIFIFVFIYLFLFIKVN